MSQDSDVENEMMARGTWAEKFKEFQSYRLTKPLCRSQIY